MDEPKQQMFNISDFADVKMEITARCTDCQDGTTHNPQFDEFQQAIIDWTMGHSEDIAANDPIHNYHMAGELRRHVGAWIDAHDLTAEPTQDRICPTCLGTMRMRLEINADDLVSLLQITTPVRMTGDQICGGE